MLLKTQKKINSTFTIEAIGDKNRRASYSVYHQPFEIEDFVYWHVIAIAPHAYVYAKSKQNNMINVATIIIAMIMVAAIALYFSKNISDSITPLVSYMRRIGRLDLKFNIKKSTSIREIYELQHSFDVMKNSLKSFEKYIPSELVLSLMKNREEAKLGGHEEELTIFFSDMVNFTQVSERFPPKELVEVVSGYLSECSDILIKRKGTVDKYIGDAIMAFWGAPQKVKDHAYQGCLAALECQEVMKKVSADLEKKGVKDIAIRIGLNSGRVVVGNMGSEKRLNYTVIGDAVNLSSRLEAINKFYGTDIMIGEETYKRTKDKIHARILDKIAVKGKEQGIEIYQLLGVKEVKDTILSPIDKKQLMLIELSEAAFSAYMDQQWDKAIEHYRDILDKFSEDKVALLMIERCQLYKEQSPGKDWDGVFRHTSK